MQYRMFGKTGEQVSVLGFGTMRLPCFADSTIDEAEAVRMLRYAIDNGVNYLDTAYLYHEGHSEALVGKALRDGYRAKTFVATKSPPWCIKCPEDFDRILDEQLMRLGVETIDFYLLHALDRDSWQNVVLRHALLRKMDAAKAAGKIRHIGFSFHDDNALFHEIVDAYDGCEFCQLQYNYIDIHNQAGTEGLEYAASKGLGVVIMEPLLGGKLANPPQTVCKVLPDTKPPVQWALDYVWNRPETSLLLSGMSTMAQVKDNLAYAQTAQAGMLDAPALAVLERAKTAFDTQARVGCTKCAYCMPCPAGVNIPGVFETYNRSAHSLEDAKVMYAALDGRADLCVACKKCESLCPQHIGISGLMSEIQELFAL